MAAHPNALILQALAIVVVTPVAGVIVRSRWSLAGGVVACAALSLALHLSLAPSGTPIRPTLLAHAVMTACALALAGIGRLAASVFDDPLDAMAASLVVSAVLGAGLFAVGEMGVRLPTPLVNIALAISPIVAIASAGSIDILRSSLLYEVSPIAHREFAYPSVLAAAAAHGALALTTLGMSVRRDRSRAATTAP